MIMMLPFLTGLVAVWFGLLGKRRPCVAFWLITQNTTRPQKAMKAQV